MEYLLHSRTGGFLRVQSPIQDLGLGRYGYNNVTGATREPYNDPPGSFLTTFYGTFETFSLNQEPGQPPIKHPDRPFKITLGPLTIFDSIRLFLLRDGEKCKNLFNELLKQLSKDQNIPLGGGEDPISYYINQLEKNGDIIINPMDDDESGGGPIDGKAYGEDGWGVLVNQRVGENTLRHIVRNYATIVGEIVHAIGRRRDLKTGLIEGKFSDMAAHQALVNLGRADSLEKAVLDNPWLKKRLIEHSDGTMGYQNVASLIYHEYTMQGCGEPYTPGTNSIGIKKPF